ncbi:MAG: twin-arginine translocase TatA/TatE family subunit [Acidimicrobiales bacterium]
MFDLSPEKLVILGLIALVVLGPERLPRAARRAGQLLTQLRQASGTFQQELRGALAEPRQVLEEAKQELGLPSIPRVPSVRRAVVDTLTGAGTGISTGVGAGDPPGWVSPSASVDAVVEAPPPVPDDPALN